MQTEPIKVTDLSSKKPSNKRPRTTAPKKTTSRIDKWGLNDAPYVRFSFKVSTKEEANNIIDGLYTVGAINWSYVHAFEWSDNPEKNLKACIGVHGLARPTAKAFDFKWFREHLPKGSALKTSFYPEGTYPKRQKTEVLQEGSVPAQPAQSATEDGITDEDLMQAVSNAV